MDAIDSNQSEVVEKVNVRLPVTMNDWLDGIVKVRRRAKAPRISKERIVAIAIDQLRQLGIDWQSVDDEASLRALLIHGQRSCSKKCGAIATTE